MGIKFTDLPARIQAQVRAQIGATRAAADREPDLGHESLGQEAAEGCDRPVVLVYRQVRKRLTDPDGHFSKYWTDALVDSGILRGDSTHEIEDIHHPQRKAAKGEAEGTVIEIWV